MKLEAPQRIRHTPDLFIKSTLIIIVTQTSRLHSVILSPTHPLIHSSCHPASQSSTHPFSLSEAVGDSPWGPPGVTQTPVQDDVSDNVVARGVLAVVEAVWTGYRWGKLSSRPDDEVV